MLSLTVMIVINSRVPKCDYDTGTSLVMAIKVTLVDVKRSVENWSTLQGPYTGTPLIVAMKVTIHVVDV